MVRCLLELHSHIYARYVMSLIPDSRARRLFRNRSSPPLPLITRVRSFRSSSFHDDEKIEEAKRVIHHAISDSPSSSPFWQSRRRRGLLETYIDFLYRIHSLDRSRYTHTHIYISAWKVIADKPGRNSSADSRVPPSIYLDISTFRGLAESSSTYLVTEGA